MFRIASALEVMLAMMTTESVIVAATANIFRCLRQCRMIGEYAQMRRVRAVGYSHWNTKAAVSSNRAPHLMARMIRIIPGFGVVDCACRRAGCDLPIDVERRRRHHIPTAACITRLITVCKKQAEGIVRRILNGVSPIKEQTDVVPDAAVKQRSGDGQITQGQRKSVFCSW